VTFPFRARRVGASAALVAALCALVGLPLFADGPAPKPLTLDQAIAEGLARDPGIRSSNFDLISAKAKALDALFRMIPSIAVSSGYTQLSAEAIPSATLPPSEAAFQPFVDTLLSMFGGAPDFSQTNSVDLQYPIFAGFRLQQAADIAKLGALGKEAGLELAKRAMAFEIERAYWESVRATSNVQTAAKALELEGVLRDEMKSMADQGMATNAELLGEQARFDQITLALDQAKSGQQLAFLGLASLIGDADASTPLDSAGYELLTAPEGQPWTDPGDDETALIASALASRPETKLATIGFDVGNHALTAAKGDLMPTVLLIGDVTYGDPDQRAFPPANLYDVTWAAGIRLRYDLGAIPGALAREKAADADMEKAKADLERQRDAIALDVRKTILALSNARNALALSKGMVAEAEENLRVTQAKFDNGLAKHSDLLQTQIAVLRANFGVENDAINLEIAEADLDRALARQNLP